MIRNNAIIAAIAAALLCSLGASAITAEQQRDYSGLISLTSLRTIASFNASTEGWQGVNGCTVQVSDGRSIDYEGDGEGSDAKFKEGASNLLISTPAMAATTWRGASKAFDTPLNLTATPMLQADVFLPAKRPGNAVWARAVLTSRSGDSFVCTSHVIPSKWSTLIFDLHQCPFLNEISGIEISFMNESDKTWDATQFLIDAVQAGAPLDLMFSIPGSERQFQATGGKVSYEPGALRFDFKAGASLATTAIKNSRNSIYNPPLDVFNTFSIVLANKSKASQLRLCYSTTTHDGFAAQRSKTIAIKPNSDFTAYYVNVSDLAECDGQLTGLRLEPVGKAKGTWLVDRIDFLQEAPLEPYAGTVRCTASKDFLTITGSIEPQYASKYKTLEIYEAPMHKADGPLNAQKLAGLECLYRGKATSAFSITSIPNSRLGGAMSRLSSRLVAVLRGDSGKVVKVAPYFYVSNWREFEPNPYAFTLPSRDFNVLDYGAKGNGFTCDDRAIQAAIDACNAAGGGRVVLPGDTASRYGRRYVITRISLKSNVELHLDAGAVLWQSASKSDYDYDVLMGHNSNIPGVPWTHCLYLNYPMVLAKDCDHVKITGPGTLLCYNRYTRNPDVVYLHSFCSDQIHLCPIGTNRVHDMEVSDIDVLLAPSYFTQFTATSRLYIGNIKMQYPTCTSGDGLGLACGMRDVLVNRIFFNSNDDGITISSSYGDPRTRPDITPWRPTYPTDDNSISNVKITHSYVYLDATGSLADGGGHGLALLPWGTSNPDVKKQIIDSITATDCVFGGPYAVGVWPDCPFDGKPFSNSERNDYSPMMNIHIAGNEYIGTNSLLNVRATNFTGDTGIRSSTQFKNGDFALGRAYWTAQGNASIKSVKQNKSYFKGVAGTGGFLGQGLYIKKGDYTLCASVSGTGKLTVKDASTGKIVASQPFNQNDSVYSYEQLKVRIDSAGDYMAGIEGGNASVIDCGIYSLRDIPQHIYNGIDTLVVEAEDYDRLRDDHGDAVGAYASSFNHRPAAVYRPDSQGADLIDGDQYSGGWAIAEMGDNEFGVQQEFSLPYVDASSNLITPQGAASTFGRAYRYTISVQRDCYVNISLRTAMNLATLTDVIQAGSGWNKPRSQHGYTVQGVQEDWVTRYMGASVMEIDGHKLTGAQAARPVLNSSNKGWCAAVLGDTARWTKLTPSDTVWVWPIPGDYYSLRPYYQAQPQYRSVKLTRGKHQLVVRSLGPQWFLDAIRIEPASARKE